MASILPKSIAVIAALCVQHAHAASREVTLAGSALSIDSPCVRHVEIRPDAGLHGQIAVSATAEHEEELARLVMEAAGTGVRVHTVREGCWRPPLDFGVRRTLSLLVRVPVGAAVALDEGGAGVYEVGAVGGPLRLDFSGAAKLSAQAVTRLHADISGSASVDVGNAEGAADIAMSGSGSFAIGAADLSTMHVNLSGAGSVAVAHGHIGSVSLDESGFGSIGIGAEVGDAHVEISGAGSVHFAKVTGALTKDVSGVGDVSVGE
jgi:hypothetical protein